MKCCGSVRKDLLASVMKKPATSSLPRYVPLMVLLPGTIHSMSSAMSFMAPSRSPAPKAWYAAWVAALFSAADIRILLNCPDLLTEAERTSARQDSPTTSTSPRAAVAEQHPGCLPWSVGCCRDLAVRRRVFLGVWTQLLG